MTHILKENEIALYTKSFDLKKPSLLLTLLARVVLLASAMMLAACNVGEDYKQPEIEADTAWNEPAETDAVIGDSENAHWWDQFADETLQELIETGLERNNDLKIAAARIEEAQAESSLSDSAFFPQINARANGKRGTLGGSFGNKIDTSREAGLEGSWDIDIFGGNRRRSEASDAGVGAAIAEDTLTRIRLIEEIAKNYARLRGLQQQRILTERNLALQQKTVHITQEQFKERVVTKLDVLRATAQAHRTESRLAPIKTEIAAVTNRIAVLTDERPRNVAKLFSGDKGLLAIPQNVAAITPLSVLRRRPDVKIAERRLAQATALSGAAFAEFFPKISLDGFFGRSRSGEFGYQSPWSASINALLPILNFGRIQSQVDVANARQKQAFYQYKQTILLAVEDTEVALARYNNELNRAKTLAKVAQEQSEAVTVARAQYSNGIVPQLDLLDAQQNMLDAQIADVQSREAALENAFTLYTALGYSTLEDQSEASTIPDGHAQEPEETSPEDDDTPPPEVL